MAQLIAQPEGSFRLGDFLAEALTSSNWTSFRAAIAFVKRSGTKHIAEALSAFSKRGSVNVSIGIDSGGTSAEGLQDLIEAVSPAGKLWVFHNANTSTFHPKIYLFKSADAAELVVGSGNLTEGGLFTNYEAAVRLVLDLAAPADRELLANVEEVLDKWSSAIPGICYALDGELLKKLVALGKVPTEEKVPEAEERSPTTADEMSLNESMFKGVRVPPAPKAPPSKRPRTTVPSSIAAKLPAAGATTTGLRAFVMTLQKTDAGYGQVRSGTARRSPEIFIPIRAVDSDPAFWGWPNQFAIDKAWSRTHAKWIASKKGSARGSSRPLHKLDRAGVVIRIVNSGALVSATMWYNPNKVDLRIRQEQLRSAGNVGDILILAAASQGASCDYEFEVVRRSDPRFGSLAKACSNKAGANSKKRYGYLSSVL
jgi:HKD family nuclease